MRIKSIAAAGALGVGLGIAGLASAGTASAACDLATTPPLERARCLTEQSLTAFGTTISPQYNAQVLLYGTKDPDTGERSGLGLVDQPATFVNSIVGEGGFLSGPIAPDQPPEAAGPGDPSPNP